MARIKSPQDLGAAIILGLLGIGGLFFGREYEVGTASAMGPGYMPVMLSGGLILFGIIVGIRSLSTAGSPLSPTHWRPILLILLSILMFALLIRTAGLLITSFAVSVVASLASFESRWKETIVLATLLAIFCVAVFIYGLGQSIAVIGSG